jgi:ubiquinone/menaquinone biosynthesis C-methylase UbiE
MTSGADHPLDVRAHNESAWDKQVDWENPWTIPVTTEAVERARRGDWEIVLAPTRPVPRTRFGDLPGLEVLGLASGGGQQGPILAAAGACVTILDNSQKQLRQDATVVDRDGLHIRTVHGSMTDLSAFADESFDLVVNPVSVVFVHDVRRVWHEVARVLRPGGALIAGFGSPAKFIFDALTYEREGRLELKHFLPYSEAELFTEEEHRKLAEEGEALLFSHTLETLIGGQLDAGLTLCGFYEDGYGNEDLLSRHMPTFIATRAVKAL